MPPAFQRVADMVREMMPTFQHRLSADEQTLAIFLRGNKDLYEALVNVIKIRTEGRAKVSLPSNPVDCMVSMARDKELRWLLSRLEAILHSPADSTQDGEQPG
jgi:hypothetical protein